MAGYGHATKGYTPYKGIGPRTNDGIKQGHRVEYECADDVCRPVIVDLDGRKKTVTAYGANQSTETVVTKIERTVDHSRAPSVVEYKYGSPVKAEPFTDYSRPEEKWSRPMSPTHDRVHRVEAYNTPERNKPSIRDEYVNKDRWEKPPSPTHDRVHRVEGYNTHNKPAIRDEYVNKDRWEKPPSPTHDRVHRVEGYNTPEWNIPAVRDEYVNKDRWEKPLSPTHNRVHRVEGYNTHNKPAIRDEYVNKDRWEKPLSPTRDRVHWVEGYNTSEWNKPTNRDEYANKDRWERPLSPSHDRARRFEGYNTPEWNKPTIRGEYGNKDRWERPTGHKGWAAPPPAVRPLTRATNDVGEAIELLKSVAVNPSSDTTAASVRPRFDFPVAASVPKKDTYGETIDSREAARRYGNFNLASRPFKRSEESYKEVIDSREAARRYGGAIVPN